jgi:MoaA/NifB/PqqE/SkfB family radical SAM enzyme
MLTTNGTLMQEMDPADIARLHQLNLSIDGPPLVLERLGRGGAKTLEKAIAGLAHVRAARRGGRPRLKLLSVITSEGAAHLVEMLELFSGRGVAFDTHLFQHEMFLSADDARRHERALGDLVGEGVPIWRAMVSEAGTMDTERLIEEMRAVRELCPDAVFSPDLDEEGVRRYYGQESWVPEDLASHCLSPWFDVAITPDGLVWLCPGHPVGSIHESGFEEIWNGEPARRIRKAIAEGGIFPGCRACFYLYNYRNPRP